MADKKTSNRRQIVDVIFILFIGFCAVLVLVQQTQSVADTFQDDSAVTPVVTARPSNGFVQPTYGPEDDMNTSVPFVRPTSDVQATATVDPESDVEDEPRIEITAESENTDG